MKVHTADGRWFALQAECEADTAFLDAVDMALQRVHVVRMLRTDGRNTTVVLSADRQDARALKAEACRQTAGAFSQLLGLLLRDPALNSHVGTLPSYPEPQEELAARLEQLQLMLQAGSVAVGQGKAVLEKVNCAHCSNVANGRERITGSAT